jgi:hypothetical protein
MTYYQLNPACRCGRCTTRGLMGPAVLVTLGVLFLLANTSDFPMERTWPILLIVIGGIRVIRYVIPSTGHVNPGLYPPPPYAGQYPPPPYAGQYPPPPYQAGPYAGAMPNTVPNSAPASGPIVTPPPAPIAGVLGDGSENDEAHNG